MEDAVRRHDAIVRAAIEKHGGTIFKTVGDAFYSVFEQPTAALSAMAEAQRGLAAEDFTAVDGLRVRAAIHSGPAESRDGDYFGSTINRVARLLAIGYGGQVLISNDAAQLVAQQLPSGTSLLELGPYHLKDFAAPELVRQLIAPGLDDEFPPLRSLGTLPADLSIIDVEEVHPVESFSGRERELEMLYEALAREPAIVVVHGPGGVGKSSVAREYAWRHRGDFSVLWWLNAQTEDGIIDGLLRLGSMFETALNRLADRRAAARRVLNELLAGFDKPVLIVFDNVEDERQVRAWQPHGSSRTLLTSRNSAWSAKIRCVHLRVWTIKTAADYLKRESRRADLTDAAAQAIASVLGTLPLALSHAAASLRRLRMVTPEQYVERIEGYLQSATRGAEYPHSVFATFRTAIAHAEAEAPGSAALLAFAAFFAPDGIPDELFRQPIANYAAELRPPLSTETRNLREALADDVCLDEGLGALDRLSLLNFNDGTRTYSMHRLVQLAARDLVADARRDWRFSAIAAANTCFPETNFETWAECERVLPHARAALAAGTDDSAALPAGLLAQKCALYLLERGSYSDAMALQAYAVTIMERTLGQTDPQFAVALDNLGLLHFRQGQFEEAEALNRRATEMLKDDPDRLTFARALNRLGNVYFEQGRYNEAEQTWATVLRIREEELGQDHTDVAGSLGNLATLRWRQARFAEATQLYRRALDIRERVLGPEHPDVARTLSALATTYHEQGRYEEAQPLHMRALSIQRKVLGSKHPELARTLSAIAVGHERDGRLREAEDYYKRALAIRENALEPHHPELAFSLSSLANVYRDQNRYGDAEPLYEKALAIWETFADPDRPDMAECLNDLGILYARNGRYDASERLHRRAHRIYEKTLGLNHPEVGASLYNLGTALARQGRASEARESYTSALMIQGAALGCEHRLTKATRAALDAIAASEN